MTVVVEPKYSFTYEGVTTNIYHANKGEGLPKHEHLYSHATMCHSGSCIVRKENKEFVINKERTPVNLKENEWHEIEALEDNTVFVNIFSSNKN
jgi:quercetin dioxygenase-like cupin family protein